MSRLLQKVFAVALLAVAAHIAKCPTATAKGCFTSRYVCPFPIVSNEPQQRGGLSTEHCEQEAR